MRFVASSGAEVSASPGTAEALSAAAEHRGGRQARRADGAYFTDHDVAAWMVRRALGAQLLAAVGVPDAVVEHILAEGDDLHGALGRATRAAHHREAALERLSSLLVLDPSCGAGSFLRAAWRELRSLERLLGARVVTLDQLHGVDVDAGAVDACRTILELERGHGRGRPRIVGADAELPGTLPAADVVVGNPPFVGGRATEVHADLATAGTSNRSAWIVERALRSARPGASVSFVLPISTSCCAAFAPVREAWEQSCDRVFASHYDAIPSSLFRGVVQRLSIFEGRVRAAEDPVEQREPARWWTSRYHRWRRPEREGLLDRVSFAALPDWQPAGPMPKVGSTLERDLLDVLSRHPPGGRFFVQESGDNRFHYKRRWSYFLLFTDFVPGIWDMDGTPRAPSEFCTVHVDARLDARALLAIYSSTLFWWHFSVHTDNRNVNRHELACFPVPDLEPATARRLAQLGEELMVSLRACAEVRTCTYRSIGTIRNTYFRQGATRPVLDRIDAELAVAYGLSADQARFVLDFERRFRS